jgi:phytoene synthase
MTEDEAYRACEEITRREAKNFAYGIRLLHPPERRALSAVYALARRIDDIGDGDAPATERLDGLSEVRKELAALSTASDDPAMAGVAHADRAYHLPLSAFDDLIDGCELDVSGATYDTIDDLVAYCRRVAGSIGRLSLPLFGVEDRTVADPIADDLGVALQLTNILRDVVEDRDRGRVYLPAGDAEAVGCAPDLLGPPEEVADLVAFECVRAQDWFDQGLELLPLLDSRGRACVSAMAGIYRRLLARIERDPLAVTRGRVSLPAWEKAVIAGQSLSGLGR